MQPFLTFRKHPTSSEQHWHRTRTQIIKGTTRGTTGHQHSSNYKGDILEYVNGPLEMGVELNCKR